MLRRASSKKGGNCMVENSKKYDLSVSLGNFKLDNPIKPATGTFGFGNEFEDF